MPDEIEIRCRCRRSTLLAIGKRDEKGKFYLHIQTRRSGRVYQAVLVMEGEVRVLCKECGRWMTVHVRRLSVESEIEPLPESVSL